VQLSQLSLAAGAHDRALQLAQDASRRAPRDADARMTLVNSLLAKRDLVAAERELQPLAASFPDSPLVLVATGQLAFAKRDHRGARAAFEKAEGAAPGSYEAFRGQLALDLVENKIDQAKARMERKVAASDRDPRALSLGAGVYLRLGDRKRAEELLKLAVEQNPIEFDAYIMLAGLYRQQNRLQEARASLESVLAKEGQAIGPHTMIGMLYEAEGNLQEAQRRYERVIQIDADAPVAANNLAYLYAESGVNLDVALQLAQVARRQLPEADQVADTLGWIYVKKDLPTLGIAPLEEAVKKQPDNATYLYHLGVALAESGDRGRGREMLNRALTLKLSDQDAAVARKLVEQL
jgi:tetratricopeptide (TPR) repeat protein